MTYHIVPMTTAHLPQVAALEKRCFPADPWSEELFRDALDNPRAAILLAEGEDGTILGYAVLSVVLDEGNLDNIAVAPEARRRGVADALLGALTGFGREHLSVLMLEVRASNAPAIALYEKHGFAAVGRRKNYYDAPKEDAILMTLEFEHGITAAE
ncbi:MAG: ribosomal protein S18-alanine N-acetyltransferase [Oscillospiraceae bacterium]|nr:ribosomal protein S18-alanine N-acetyltransferase [Oscillospiraceae bacterium]MDE7171637.1 ribosomal protein S18-alanine N-acetyltransferase [Oscillospiraceae bacterium]